MNRKLSILVAMVTEQRHDILPARIYNVCHASDFTILHTAVVLYKANTHFFLKQTSQNRRFGVLSTRSVQINFHLEYKIFGLD